MIIFVGLAIMLFPMTLKELENQYASLTVERQHKVYTRVPAYPSGLKGKY